MTNNYAPFHHNVDAPDHGRALRVTATDVAGEISIAAGRYRIDQTVTNRPVATTYPAIPPLGNGVNYIYIDALGAINSNIGGPYPANSIPLARVTVAAGVIVPPIVDDRCFFYEDTAAGGGANTLDQAYDQGGAGAGRQINAQDGAVLITNPDVDAGIPNLELTRAPGDIAAQQILGLRAVGDAAFRFEMLGNGVMRWGTGAGAVDIVLERTAANRLGLAVGDIFEADTIGSRGGAQVSMEDGVSIPEFLGLPPTLIGIVAGVAIPVRSHHSLSAQAGVADDLDTLNIAPGPAIDGDVCIIRPDTGDTITVKHNIGNLLCVGNADIVLDDDHDFCICIYNATLTKWMCLSDTGGAGGVQSRIQDGDNDTYVETDAGGADPDQVDVFTGGARRLTIGAVGAEFEQVVTAMGTAPNANNWFEASPNAPVADARIGLKINPLNPVLAGGVGEFQGIFGAPNLYAPAGAGGAKLQGLNFMVGAAANNVAATFSYVNALHVRAGAVAAGPGGNLTITEERGVYVQIPSIQAIAGAALVVTNYTCVDVEDVQNALVQNLRGLKIDDCTLGSVSNRILELGPAVAGGVYMRLEGSTDFPGAVGTTPLHLAEVSAGPVTTMRRVQWKDGAAIGAGDKVMILV